MMKSKGSSELEKFLEDIVNVHNEIVVLRDKRDKISDRLSGLEDLEDKLERRISTYLMEGTRLPDPFLDYCFCVFGEKVLDNAYLIKGFMNAVEESIGEKIISVYERSDKGQSKRKSAVIQTGIISGPCNFGIEDSPGIGSLLGPLRSLYVPVKKMRVLKQNSLKWKKGDEIMRIDPDIFIYRKHAPSIDSKAIDYKSWETDYSGDIIFGLNPGKTLVYIGDKLVDDALKKYSAKKVIREELVDILPPF